MDSKGIYLRNNLAYLLGDLEVFEVDTYRYIFPLCKKFRYNKSELPYPVYKKGVFKIDLKRDKTLIKERLKKFIDDL